MSPGVAIMAFGLFGLMNKVDFGKKVSSIVCKISKSSFCAYLIHVFFIHIFEYLGLSVRMLPCIVSIPLLAAINLICCYLVYQMISRIPIAKIL